MSFMSVFKVIEKEHGWVNFQIESFNHFIEYGIQGIIDEIGTVSLNPELGDHKLMFGKVHIGKPSIKEADGSTRQIFPNEARVRSLTYAAPVYVDITPIINGVQEKPGTWDVRLAAKRGAALSATASMAPFFTSSPRKMRG